VAMAEKALPSALPDARENGGVISPRLWAHSWRRAASTSFV
jgi:hypothetical protein